MRSRMETGTEAGIEAGMEPVVDTGWDLRCEITAVVMHSAYTRIIPFIYDG